MVGIVIQGFICHFNEFSQIGAAFWNGVGGNGSKRTFKSIVIEGQRTHQVGRTSKRHKSNPVTFKLFNKIKNSITGALKSVGFYILCQH